MDYFGILKKAWNVTWHNKALWILGFFAVTSSSGGNFGNGSGWQESASTSELDQVAGWVEANVGLIIALVVALVLIGLVMAVLGIAARGGLVHMVNEVEEGRPVMAGSGWHVGFRYWGRTFMIGLVLALPILLIVLVMAAMLFGAGLGLSNLGAESASAGLGFGGAMCCMLPVFIILIFGAAFLVSVIGELAVRYGVLHDVSFGQAIKRGWDDVWAKRGAAVMWLVMLLPGFAYGMVMFVAMLVILVPAVLLFISGAVVAGIVLIVVLMLLMLLPGAIYNTFYSASWTIFFRRMTGVDTTVAPSGVGVTQSYMPPPPVPPTAAPPVAPPAGADTLGD